MNCKKRNVIDAKKILSISLLLLFMFAFVVPFVVADDTPTPSPSPVSTPQPNPTYRPDIQFGDSAAQSEDISGIKKDITEPEWLVIIIKFMGFGKSWADVIISLAVLAMIFAAAYDILEFTSFKTDWVKITIAIAIALVASVSGATREVAGFFMGLAAGSVAIATSIVILIAIVFFIVGSFAKGKLSKFKSKIEAEEAEGAFKLAKEKVKADIAVAKAAAKEAGKSS